MARRNNEKAHQTEMEKPGSKLSLEGICPFICADEQCIAYEKA